MKMAIAWFQQLEFTWSDQRILLTVYPSTGTVKRRKWMLNRWLKPF